MLLTLTFHCRSFKPCCALDSDKFYDWVAEAAIFNTVLLRSDLIEHSPSLLTVQFQAFAVDAKNRREAIVSEFDAAVSRTADAYRISIVRFLDENWFSSDNC